MSGWHILAGCVACGSGALVFLKLVADEIELATAALHLYEKQARKAYERRCKQALEMGTAAPAAA